MPIDPDKAQGLMQGMQSQEGLGPLKKLFGMGNPDDALKQALDDRKMKLQAMKSDYDVGPVLK